MAFDRSAAKAKFKTGQPTPWRCPGCNEGRLRPKDKTFSSPETRRSKDARGHEDWEPTWITERFCGVLECNNKDCAEAVVVCGKTVWDDEMDDEHGWIIAQYLEPQFFLPAPDLIEVPSNASEELKQELRSAFSLYWSDPAACANRIRSALELLLTHLG